MTHPSLPAVGDERCLVGILGGGQLGRMLALAGLPLGCSFRFLDPAAAPPSAATGPTVCAPLDDPEGLDALAAGAAVVTYEWEGVPSAAAARLDRPDRPVWPPVRALDVAQDRLREKQLFTSLGIGTAPHAAVDSLEDLEAALERIGTPAILKTRFGGYDGKGQVRINHVGGAPGAWAELAGTPLILEGFVPFGRELSVIAVRGAHETLAWPVMENHHADGILRLTLAPAPGWTPQLQERAEAIVFAVLDALEYRGVCCVELFEVDGELLANEIAPRVHNSGHWTIEGSETSQFENHIRAVVGWPLGSTALVGVSAMVNCIGALPDRRAVLAVPGAHFHDYEKSARPGRKVGHVTVRAADEGGRDERVERIRALVASADE